MTALRFYIAAGIYPVHVCEHKKLKQGARVDFSPMTEIYGVQIVAIQFVADFDQFFYGIVIVDSDSQIQGYYCLISVSYCAKWYLLSGSILFTNLLYHESSDRAIFLGQPGRFVYLVGGLFSATAHLSVLRLIISMTIKSNAI